MSIVIILCRWPRLKLAENLSFSSIRVWSFSLHSLVNYTLVIFVCQHLTSGYHSYTDFRILLFFVFVIPLRIQIVFIYFLGFSVFATLVIFWILPKRSQLVWNENNLFYSQCTLSHRNKMAYDYCFKCILSVEFRILCV